MPDTLKVEVVYAGPERQEVVNIIVAAGTDVQQAVTLSGLLRKYPEIDLATARLGVFSRIMEPSSVLRDGDRVEIYRPLIADPKEIRRQRAAKSTGRRKPASIKTDTANESVA